MKKAISPLIATVLLIGFTVVLAALIIQWGGHLINNTELIPYCASLNSSEDFNKFLNKAGIQNDKIYYENSEEFISEDGMEIICKIPMNSCSNKIKINNESYGNYCMDYTISFTKKL